MRDEAEHLTPRTPWEILQAQSKEAHELYDRLPESERPEFIHVPKPQSERFRDSGEEGLETPDVEEGFLGRKGGISKSE
jgi:hypothetical protein